MGCFLARYSQRPCWGPTDPAHLITKQRIKREAPDADVWDRRIWRWACRRHHADFDHYNLSVPRSAIPKSVWEFAREHGLENALARDRRYV